jgi:RecA/RadA recombinase
MTTKIDEDAPYRISAEQLIERTSNRPIIPCTLSSDVGLSGGIPLGATVLIGGKSKLGKTTYALQCAANAQNLYGVKVFFFPAEGRLTNLTLKQVRGLKKDIDNFETVMPPPMLDKKGEVIGHKKWHANQWYDVVGKTIQENPRSIIIVDSLASMTSEKEMSERMGYQGRGDLQKAESQFCRLFGDLMISNNITSFLLTHIQANTSGQGASMQMKVGNSIRFAADIILFGKWAEKWKADADGKILGHDIHYQVEASAMGAPWGDMVVPLRYGYGIDNIKDIITHCTNWGIIDGSGSWFTLPYVQAEKGFEYLPFDQATKDLKHIKFQGEQKLWRFLAQPSSSEIVDKLDKMVRERIFGNEPGI